jgi:hypothetical protein
MSELRSFLEAHLASIFAGDVEGYHQTTTEDLTIYEWHVTPHRIDGLPFHDFMLEESANEDTATMALDPAPDERREAGRSRARFDLSNYKEQRYGDSAVCSYTMLISQATEQGVKVLSYNESRVIVRLDGEWRVVHVHKSPAWPAPFQPPGSSPDQS